MHSLRDLIYTISKRPEIYIGRPSLERLYAFIGGYLTANHEMDDHCLDGFNEFVSHKFNINTDHNWAEIIQFFSTNEQQAFNEFRKLFEEFQETHGGMLLYAAPGIIHNLPQEILNREKQVILHGFSYSTIGSLKTFLQEFCIHDGIFRYATYDHLHKRFVVQFENRSSDQTYKIIFNGIRKFNCISDYKWGEKENIIGFTMIDDATKLPTYADPADCKQNLCFVFDLLSGNQIFIVCTFIEIEADDKTV